MEEIKNLLNKVKHPEINNSLVELGMIGKVQKEEENIVVELKLPMPEIPIKESLIDLIKSELKKFKVKIEVSVMNDKERLNFFELSHKNWAL